MTQLTPIQLDDGTVIYLEATETVTTSPLKAPTSSDEEEEVVTRGGAPSAPQRQLMQNFQAVQGTIRAYTYYTLNAFKGMAIANIDEVTLQFGIEVGGEAGIPYITKGQAKSNLNITVKCSFPTPQPEE